MAPVDAVIGLGHDFLDELVRETRRNRALGAAGKRAIQVAPVRQVARLVQEAVHVDDGHGDQRPANGVRYLALEQAPNNLDTI